MKISIITVTYNSARTLSRAIRSIMRQTYQDIEYIIVDGESADSTIHVIQDFASRYSNIHYISEPDNGIYDAINKGIHMATGDIIGLLNSDDELANPETLSHIADRMTQSQADILYGDLVYCRYEAIEHNPPRIVRYWKSNPFRKEDLRWGWMPAHPTMYCRRKVFEEVGDYRTDFRISADYEFVQRVFKKDDYKKEYLPEVIVKMEVGGVSNRDLHTMCVKTREDWRVMRMHGLSPMTTICFKVLRKIHQFFR